MWGRGGRVVRVALRAIVGPAMGILKIDRTGFSASPGAKGYFFCPKMGIRGNNVRKYMYVIVHLLIMTTTVYVQHPWPFLRLSNGSDLGPRTSDLGPLAFGSDVRIAPGCQKLEGIHRCSQGLRSKVRGLQQELCKLVTWR